MLIYMIVWVLIMTGAIPLPLPLSLFMKIITLMIFGISLLILLQ
jgi:hypothetical protein